MKNIVFIDTEISVKSKKIKDLGAIREENSMLHTNNLNLFVTFIKDAYYICGHNIVDFDSKYIEKSFIQTNYVYIDTLMLSPLMYPKKQYYSLLKDDKLQTTDFNNPLSDAKKCKELFYYEINAFNKFPEDLRNIFGTLLFDKIGFKGFFDFVKWNKENNLTYKIKSVFKNKICDNANVQSLIDNYPIELAYSLSLINADDKSEIIPGWVNYNYPKVELVMRVLRGISCNKCLYCKTRFDAKKRLKEFFNYDNFRTFDGENLQEEAVNCAIENKSLLAVFPTGGGKSITFQLPALIQAETNKGLTVVISPLQSLMKDQVDSLERKDINSAVTINGLLDPIQRKKSIERVYSGQASILYISPESLRNKSVERLLMSRHISRFVIDEAHCFSSWGHDFRIDYLYIGDFIKKLQEEKQLDEPTPVSCFTATAKPKVISDICDYFYEKLGLHLEIFASKSTRKNLHYKVELKENDEEKYSSLRDLILYKNCPTIVYTSRVKSSINLANKLQQDGIKALAYNGQMDPLVKTKNQNDFIDNKIQVMVATSAFGMGIDKPDVKLVVHYDISDSLENYVQEAGRAGRDSSIDADCVVYYNQEDLNKHFSMLNNSKVRVEDINNVWRAIKKLSNKDGTLCKSAREIANAVGYPNSNDWSSNRNNIDELKVKTAIAALEHSGYLVRKSNSPRVFATSINCKNVDEMVTIAKKSNRFDEEEIKYIPIICSKLLTDKHLAIANNGNMSRVDVISETIGKDKRFVINIINKLKEIKVLADDADMSASISLNERKSLERKLNIYNKIEMLLIDFFEENASNIIDLKEFNTEINTNKRVQNNKINSIKNIFKFYAYKKYLKYKFIQHDTYQYELKIDVNKLREVSSKKLTIAEFLFNYLYDLGKQKGYENIPFSVVSLLNAFNHRHDLFSNDIIATINDIEDALYYLDINNLINMDGGFLIIYGPMNIERKELNNSIRYKKEDYKQLKEFYTLKVQQIHIVGAYANMMVEDYNKALEFVNDYFGMEYKSFLHKYFTYNEIEEMNKSITPSKYKKLFGNLSVRQKEIIDDNDSKYIGVIAGPGSGKTRVLVHKLASLLLMEDVKAEDLLMLTFSRAAASEFKTRLINLIGTAAYYVDIKTFHSFCFDLLSKLGNEEEFDEVVGAATELILNNDVDSFKIKKSVLVIDEAQDMSKREYDLVEALIQANPEMRIIAVGDDDQNIYRFRNSYSKYFESFLNKEETKTYTLLDNYRSCKRIINFANLYANRIKYRLKSDPIVPIRDKNGSVKIVYHKSDNLEMPLVEDVIKNKKNNETIAILTQKNEEALKVVCLLNEKNVKAQLIQSLDSSMSLYNLVEIRDFIECISNRCISPVIEQDDWDYALTKLNKKYKDTNNIEFINKMLNSFDKLNKCKYKSDLIEFIRESQYEDFIDFKDSNIIVSTIHKSKGHEFDKVYLLLDHPQFRNEDDKRKLYVGITRAKDDLIIHINNDLFNNMPSYVTKVYDNNVYPMPRRLVMDLGYKGVNLGKFKDNYRTISIATCKSGDKLEVIDDYLKTTNNVPITFYYSHNSHDEIVDFINNGYKITGAYIKNIVYWRDKKDLNSPECLVILPIIYFYNDKVKDYLVNHSKIRIVQAKVNNKVNTKSNNSAFEEISNNLIEGYKELMSHNLYCGRTTLVRYLKGIKLNRFVQRGAHKEKHFGIYANSKYDFNYLLCVLDYLINCDVFVLFGSLYNQVLRLKIEFENLDKYKLKEGIKKFK